jgi:hypothetical protein
MRAYLEATARRGFLGYPRRRCTLAIATVVVATRSCERRQLSSVLHSSRWCRRCVVAPPCLLVRRAGVDSFSLLHHRPSASVHGGPQSSMAACGAAPLRAGATATPMSASGDVPHPGRCWQRERTSTCCRHADPSFSTGSEHLLQYPGRPVVWSSDHARPHEQLKPSPQAPASRGLIQRFSAPDYFAARPLVRLLRPASTPLAGPASTNIRGLSAAAPGGSGTELTSSRGEYCCDSPGHHALNNDGEWQGAHDIWHWRLRPGCAC